MDMNTVSFIIKMYDSMNRDASYKLENVFD